MKSLITSVLCFVFLLLLISGCNRDKQTGDNTFPGFVDPVNDLEGYLSSFDSSLYVLPDRKDAVLKVLNAEPFEGSMYKMTGTTISGSKIPFLFYVKPVMLPTILFDLSESYRRIIEQNVSRDTARGDSVGAYQRNGIFYRVYRNAQCSEISKAYTSNCNELIFYEISADSTRLIAKHTGIFCKFEYQAVNHCLKGNIDCVERLGVTVVRKHYGDSQCQNLVSAFDSEYGYSCLK